MTLELIAFIVSILFGILLYWRESNGNGLYRFFNKLLYSKKLQMKPEDKTGFVYKQKLLLRIVFITFLYIIGIALVRFFIPIDFNVISLFASGILGTLVGTYLANAVFKSEKIIEDKGESITEIVQDAVEKGKDFMEDLKPEKEQTKTPKPETKAKTKQKQKKSARQRLKDKGLM